MEVAAELSRIIINETSDQQIIVVKEKNGTRSFPIVIGLVEIFAIDRRIKGLRPPRPLTHELLASVIEGMGGDIEKIVIDDLRNSTFFAKLHIRVDGHTKQIDARPSDAIALTAGERTPIFVEDHVFDQTAL